MKVFKLMTKKVNPKTEKANWLEIGVMFQGEKGLSGYLNNNPDVQVYLFEQKPREQQNANYQQNPGAQGQPYQQQQPKQQQPGNISFSDPTPGEVPF